MLLPTNKRLQNVLLAFEHVAIKINQLPKCQYLFDLTNDQIDIRMEAKLINRNICNTCMMIFPKSQPYDKKEVT